MENEAQQEKEQFVSVELLGQRYTFRTEDDLAKANEIARLYAREVEKVRKDLTRSQARPTDQVVLIIAALNIADQQYELEKKLAELKKEITDRSVNLVERLNVYLK